MQYPYWGFPYGYGGIGWPFTGPVGFPNGYPNGFQATTPAVQSGVVLQTRALITNPALPPTIMYDIRVTGELGSTAFPEAMVYSATPGVAGYQTVNYGGTLAANTVIALLGIETDTILINGVTSTAVVGLPIPTTVSGLLLQLNTQYNNKAVFTLVSGNIHVASVTLGSASSIVILLGGPSLFAALPGFVSLATPVFGVASGLDQATAAYEVLVK